MNEKKSKVISPVDLSVSIGKNNENVKIIINGKKIDTEDIKAFTIQYTGNSLVIDIEYNAKNITTEVSKKKTNGSTQRPSIKGIDVQESKDPEVYTLTEDNLLKLGAMSFLRTNKTENEKLVSKLQIELDKSNEYNITEKEVVTEKYNITEITSMTSALNDLAVQEQKIQKDPKVVKVEELSSPRIVIVGDIFHLVEKFKLYMVKE